jgi:hypothetical protein
VNIKCPRVDVPATLSSWGLPARPTPKLVGRSITRRGATAVRCMTHEATTAEQSPVVVRL